MAKRLMASLGMLALLLTTAVPALAQEEQQQYVGGEVSATGVIIDELPADVAANGTHSISDGATGTLYALRSAGPDLDSYGSQRVTVYGTLTPGEGPAPGEEFGGSLPSIDVSRVEPADELEPGARIVTATGVLGEPYTPSPDPTPVYDLTDEATGNTYTLFDIGAGLDAYVGQRVTVEGTRSPGINPLALDVTSVVPADGSGEGEEITATFELAVECEPPADTTFFAGASQQTAGLTDPDGDGVYTGSLTLPEGFYDLGAFEVPVDILAGTPEVPNQQVIKSFGEMVLEDGDAFSASVSFCDDGTEPVDPAPVNPAPVNPAPGGGTDNGDGGAMVSGDTNDVNKGGMVSGDTNNNPVVSGDSNNANGAPAVSGDADAANSSDAPQLPATGGLLPVAGAIGALLLAGFGLIARRFSR